MIGMTHYPLQVLTSSSDFNECDAAQHHVRRMDQSIGVCVCDYCHLAARIKVNQSDKASAVVIKLRGVHGFQPMYLVQR